MGLQCIYGRAGTGKSTYLFEEINKRIKENKKIYMITPEQFSFTAEKKLLETVEANSILQAEVLTFNRMAYRVLQEVGKGNITRISKCGKSMLLFDILQSKKKQLKFLGKSLENIELVDTQITEFKKHNISVETLKQVMEEEEDKYLQAKLQDMYCIYEAFEEKLQNHYIDENDVLTLLAEEIENSHIADNACIYIDEFVGFTKQEYEIIRKLLRITKDVTVAICADDLQIRAQEADVFYSNKNTMYRLIELAEEEEIEVLPPIELQERKRLKSKELAYLESNIYALQYKPYEKMPEDISLFLAKNAYTEVEHIAKQIVELVKKNGYQYKDIAVISKNLEVYGNLCKILFEQYQIPHFIDEKKDLNQNILMKYMIAILNVFAQNWSYESVFNYIKTGFIDLEQEEIYELENQCLEWGIKGSKWYSKPWNKQIRVGQDESKLERLEVSRKIVVEPLLHLKEEMQSKTVREMTKAVYNFLIEQGIFAKLQKKVEEVRIQEKEELAKEYAKSWEILMQVLDEIVLVFGDETMGMARYMDLFKTGLSESNLGKIPAGQDQVTVGDVDRSRSHKVKAIFIIGLNDGVFPSIHKNEGYFNDEDREKLKQEQMELAKGTLDRLYEENFNIYKAFTTAEEKLYISYASSDLEGKSLRGSVLITKLKRMFPNLIEKSDIVQEEQDIVAENNAFLLLMENIRKWADGEEIDDKWFTLFAYFYQKQETKIQLERALEAIDFKNMPQKIEAKQIEKLYGKTLKTSISRLEQYSSCPFSYFLKYSLQLEEKAQNKIKAVDTGSFMHDVIDSFFEKLKANGYNQIKQITKEQIDEMVEEIVKEKLGLDRNYIFTSTPKYQILAIRLKKLVARAIQYIVESLKESDFEVLGTELEFKDGKNYKPIQITLESGRVVEITGKIDRVDIAKNEDGTYVRIIDYKSSAKDIQFSEVYAGLQIQLITYMDAMCKEEDFIPAGMLYFNLIEPNIKASKSLTQEEIEEEVRKQFKMKGLILADAKVVKMMDKKLEKGNSSIVPAYIDKEGNVSKSGTSKAITRKQCEELQQYIQKVIGRISEEILSGNIAVEPYYKLKGKKTPCEYCSYKSICQFNAGFGNQYHYIRDKGKDVVLEEIRKQCEEEKHDTK